MAAKKKSTRKVATQHEKAVLKAAKARGLTKIDLRKPLSRYARSLVKDFEPVYRQEASVVKIDAKAKKAYKNTLTVKRGYAIVPKEDIRKSARFDKKTHRIIVGGKPLTPETVKFPDLKPGKRYAVPFATPRGIRYRYFSGQGAGNEMATFMARYEPENGGTYSDWEDFVEVRDDPNYKG